MKYLLLVPFLCLCNCSYTPQQGCEFNNGARVIWNLPQVNCAQMPKPRISHKKRPSRK